MRFRFTAPLFRWQAREDSWFFVRLPAGASADIREIPLPPRGFGSVPVRVAIGGSRWSTSVFPESADGAYVLPIKRSVREAEGLGEGDDAAVELEIVS